MQQKLQALVRQGRDLSLITSAQHEHAARMLDEIGRLLGGWRKAQARAATGATEHDANTP
ncbi:hypothetical protein EYB53_022780 [Candidatus Chloroploca sp. M-50]|uniref:Uncharacterized protein n=1 Tax=Candidatus Chloroploca mongolica TaxID=2528176 RepID=A0ABS4DGJ6_9CHLR|nr:four helix bundle protein [Candidatus Chloroploca mongolica]MBP1468556.1 hypothetical protein [Candidatus Chloroploca mongolica]